MRMAGWFFVVFLPARAGQASETVPVLNSDKVMTWTITNYENNNSNGNQFTPYKPQERKKEEDVFSRLLLKQQCIQH